jgi:hypothetical protein
MDITAQTQFFQAELLWFAFRTKALISREMWHERFNPERKITSEGADETIREIRAAKSHCSLLFGKARARPLLSSVREPKAGRPNRIEQSGFPTTVLKKI